MKITFKASNDAMSQNGTIELFCLFKRRVKVLINFVKYNKLHCEAEFQFKNFVKKQINFLCEEKYTLPNFKSVYYRLFFMRSIALFLHKFTWIVLQFISWTNWVNSGTFMDNCWISCQVMADMEKYYNDLIIINLYAC